MYFWNRTTSTTGLLPALRVLPVKKMAMFIIIALAVLPVSLSSHRYINVPGDGEPLEHYLCNDTVSSTLSNTTLVLSRGVHRLPGNHCVVRNIENFAIIGGNFTDHTSHLSCPHQHSLGGLTFFKILNLTLESIHVGILNACSAPLPHEVAQHDNSSTFHFGPKQESTIYISNCRDITIASVEILNSKAFSILLVNAMGKVEISKVYVGHSNVAGYGCSNDDYTCAGSGIAFYYHDNASTTALQTTVMVKNSSFILNNNIFFPDLQSELCFIKNFNDHQGSLPLVTAAALSFVFTQTTFNVSAWIVKCSLLDNNPLVMLTLFNNKPGMACVNLDRVVYEMNDYLYANMNCASSVFHIAIDYKVDTTLTETTPVNLHNVSIVNELSIYPSIYISTHSPPATNISLIFTYLTCRETRVNRGGSCVTAEKLIKSFNQPSGKVFLHFKYITAKHNILVGKAIYEHVQDINHYYLKAVFMFTRIDQVTVEGNESIPSIFQKNRLSAIVAYASNLKLVGHIIFSNNHGAQGGALSMYDSYLILTEGVHTIDRRVVQVDGQSTTIV